MAESLQQRAEKIVSYQANAAKEDDKVDYYPNHHKDEYQTQELMKDPIEFQASINPEVMYYHNAMQALDCEEFTQAIIDKVNAHIDADHWEMIPMKTGSRR